MSDKIKAKQPNRLIREKSPYLLQHAFNPVDWYPWGPEAFEKARKANRPIFLSIGYSACHWCHVMEKESFEDIEVAGLMNEAFICIKVDREERPDIDSAYMTACQMMTNSGGWPLTIIMTAEGKPFFASTYIPKKSRFGRIGMLSLIPQIREIWHTQRKEVEESSEKIILALKNLEKTPPSEELRVENINDAFERLALKFDELHGGFGEAPKFPSPHTLMFLLRFWRRSKQELALRMVKKTLQAMRLGGIFDHLGFGFHRYSTDSRWLLPHFEKMLYDQAMLAMTYTEAFQATGIEDFKITVQEILHYVIRDMTSSEGGFYSAEDADSEGEEGKFYLWTENEIRELLSVDDAELAIKVFNVEKEGNFFEEATGKKNRKNILHLSKPHKETASDMKIQREFLNKLDNIRQTLFKYRESRPRPHKDDKILTDWNGLMIAALAKASQVLDEEKYLRIAMRTANFILKRVRDKEGRLSHRYKEGEASIGGFLEDYAFLSWGLIELYEASFDTQYLKAALELTNIMIEYFWDEEAGGFYHTASDAEKILVRKKEAYDSAIPSGNSVAVFNLLRLAHITANPVYEEKASKVFQVFSGRVSAMPESHAYMMLALDFAIGPTYEAVIVGSRQAEDTKFMFRALKANFIPNKVAIFRPVDEESPEMSRISKFTSDYKDINGKATAYICQNHTCQLPTNSPDEMLKLLGAT